MSVGGQEDGGAASVGEERDLLDSLLKQVQGASFAAQGDPVDGQVMDLDEPQLAERAARAEHAEAQQQDVQHAEHAQQPERRDPEAASRMAAAGRRNAPEDGEPSDEQMIAGEADGQALAASGEGGRGGAAPVRGDVGDAQREAATRHIARIRREQYGEGVDMGGEVSWPCGQHLGIGA